MEEIKDRLRKYCMAHANLVQSGIIKGLNPNDGNIVLFKDGITKSVSIDILENDMFDFDKFEIKEKEEKIEEVEQIEEIETLSTNISNVEKIPSNLKELKDCIDNKEEKNIDKALEGFAIDENGTISINKAINVVTKNSMDNIINSEKDNKILPFDLSKYDIEGKNLSDEEDIENKISVDEKIEKEFSNILLYVEIAKLKNIKFNEAQIENAKNKFSISVKDKLHVLGLDKKNDNVVNINESKNKKSLSLELKPDTSIKKAGFADILILTIIILIYAAIIINLIMKLS